MASDIMEVMLDHITLHTMASDIMEVMLDHIHTMASDNGVMLDHITLHIVELPLSMKAAHCTNL